MSKVIQGLPPTTRWQSRWNQPPCWRHYQEGGRWFDVHKWDFWLPSQSPVAAAWGQWRAEQLALQPGLPPPVGNSGSRARVRDIWEVLHGCVWAPHGRDGTLLQTIDHCRNGLWLRSKIIAYPLSSSSSKCWSVPVTPRYCTHRVMVISTRE